MRTILLPDELIRIEREHDAGVSSRQVVEVFQERGVRFSEATFRKYVQVGLLPRSRRVGRKGKNRGSKGVYPAAVFRRVNAIKSMMAEGMTLEQIRGSYLFLRGELDVLEQNVATVVAQIDRAITAEPLADRERSRLSSELLRARGEAASLTRRLERLGSRIAAARQAAGTTEPTTSREGT